MAKIPPSMEVAKTKSLNTRALVKTARGIKYICKPQRCKERSSTHLA